jgi:hypothetical protein
MRFMVVPHKGFSIETKPAGRLRRCLDETPVSYTREEWRWMSADENIFHRVIGCCKGCRPCGRQPTQLALASTARPM